MEAPGPNASLAGPASPARLPSLDGWRALSIILVLGSHCIYREGFPVRLVPAFTWLFDGGLGVRCFFVISGFLITYLLVSEERRTRAVSLRRFYTRRAFRILPVYAAFLLVLLILQETTPFHIEPWSWWANLTFTTNLFGSSTWANGHLWSLAQEEQFYLVWPVALVALRAAESPRAASFLLAIPILLSPVLRVLIYLDALPLPHYHPGIGSGDSIAFGCLAALLYVHRRDRLAGFLRRRRAAVALVSVVLVGVPYCLFMLLAFGVFTVPFGETCEAVGLSMLILLSIVDPGMAVFRALNARLAVEIGALSYSIYIWQQIFSSDPSEFGAEKARWLLFPWWPLAALAVACVSYYALEKPFFGLRRRFAA